MLRIRPLLGTALGVLLGVVQLYPAAMADGKQLLNNTCGACHKQEDGSLSRIIGQRKTPEAWQMTIFRMRHLHGLQIDVETQRQLVQYLSDTQGLAPEETQDLRYAFDRSPAAQELKFDKPMMEMCGRCHTAARVALQRRSPEEWRTHIDFHLGQFPTTEYQALGRDREWYKIAVEEMVPLLAKQYPLETEAWTQWQAADKTGCDR
ncbi:MAG: c-type cytochrome [Thiolinea sp.]